MGKHRVLKTFLYDATLQLGCGCSVNNRIEIETGQLLKCFNFEFYIIHVNFHIMSMIIDK